MKIERSTVISAAPSRVWDLLADWERQAEWMPDVAWIRVVGEERAAGAMLAVRTKVLGIPVVTDRVRVIAWDPPRLLGVEHEGFVRGRGAWRLEPFGSGTRFVWVEDLRLPLGPLGEAALRLYGPVQRAMLGRSLANLRRRCEQAAPERRRVRRKK